MARWKTVYPRHLMVVLLGSTNRFSEGASAFATRLAALRSMGGCRSAGRSKKTPLTCSCENEAADWCSNQRWRLSRDSTLCCAESCSPRKTRMGSGRFSRRIRRTASARRSRHSRSPEHGRNHGAWAARSSARRIAAISLPKSARAIGPLCPRKSSQMPGRFWMTFESSIDHCGRRRLVGRPRSNCRKLASTASVCRKRSTTTLKPRRRRLDSIPPLTSW